MSTVKSKLAASVRQVKKQATVKAEKSDCADKVTASATTSAAIRPAASSALSGEPPASAQQLFPSRVWPD